MGSFHGFFKGSFAVLQGAYQGLAYKVTLKRLGLRVPGPLLRDLLEVTVIGIYSK